MPAEFRTADLSDKLGAAARIAAPGFRDYGGLSRFAGPVRTIRCYQDNTRVRASLEGPGNGAVLVVDGGASLQCALLGDQLAALAVRNGWSGIVVNGCIRDADVIAGLPIGIKALATHPRRSNKQGQGETDLVLVFAGVTVAPGDYLYADTDGWLVTASPPD